MHPVITDYLYGKISQEELNGKLASLSFPLGNGTQKSHVELAIALKNNQDITSFVRDDLANEIIFIYFTIASSSAALANNNHLSKKLFDGAVDALALISNPDDVISSLPKESEDEKFILATAFSVGGCMFIRQVKQYENGNEYYSRSANYYFRSAAILTKLPQSDVVRRMEVICFSSLADCIKWLPATDKTASENTFYSQMGIKKGKKIENKNKEDYKALAHLYWYTVDSFTSYGVAVGRDFNPTIEEIEKYAEACSHLESLPVKHRDMLAYLNEQISALVDKDNAREDQDDARENEDNTPPVAPTRLRTLLQDFSFLARKRVAIPAGAEANTEEKHVGQLRKSQ